MPSRLLSLALLSFWAVAAGLLFTRDVLPDLWIGSPPDMRSVAQAESEPGPTTWLMLVAERDDARVMRSVGQVTTQTTRQQDGWVRMSSQALFDAGQLLRGTPLQSKDPAPLITERISVQGACEIDPSGNLSSFRAGVRLGEFSSRDVVVVEGHLRADQLMVQAHGDGGIRYTQSFPYQPRSMVQNTFQPMDRMPGIQVGQKWESRVVSPLTGRVETARVEVAGRGYITWDSNPTSVLIVVTRMQPFTARTWVRADGLVLRQEVPFPLVRLILERQPEVVRQTREPLRRRGR